MEQRFLDAYNKYGCSRSIVVIKNCFKDTRLKWTVQGEYKGEVSLYECRAFNINEVIMLAQEYGFSQINSAHMVRE